MTHDPIPLLEALVAIDSTNPALVAGGAGEAEIAAFAGQWLIDHGVEASVVETAVAGRPNVVARVRGTGNGPTLMLNAHLDTVGVETMTHPFEPRIESGRLFGRGALDTKGGLTAAMAAMAELHEQPPKGDVILTAVADEEHASIGTEAVTNLDAAAAIVYEPTDLALVIAHKGFVWLDVEVTGRAAHGSRPDLGVDAISNAARIITDLTAINENFAAAPRHPHLTPESLHASLISGGQERSSYADRCTVGLEVRCHPNRSGAEIAEMVQKRIDKLASTDPELEAQVSIVFARSGYEGDPDSEIALSLRSAIQDRTSTEAAIRGHDGWMDSALLAAAGIQSVVFGPQGQGLHAATEWVDLE
ncbi:MAG: ArgE/DapE family deacylase, partial [Acidimicrobiia bacterium]